ncbi:MAG: hypothetical protein ACK4TL_08150 [Hyphomicrobiaceae bacterium]
MPPPAGKNGAPPEPPPLLPHQRSAGPPPDEGQRTPPPPPPIPSATPTRTQAARPLPHTVRETTLPPSLSASLARLAGREPHRGPEPPRDATPPPERKRSGA